MFYLLTRRFGAVVAFGIGTSTMSADSAPAVTAEMREATSQLRAHQKPEGYWLTAFTPSARFGQASFELNTFVSAMVADVIAPVSETAGLQDVVARAKSFLTSQIEADGLVRYYGRADRPSSPWSGGLITPDADDTALAWTVAGGKESTLPNVLSVLKSYRTEEGLYRTWLDRRDRFVGINPGADPNPTDLGIQMDVLVFLARYAPKEGRCLCAVLQPLMNEDRLWVYYQETPLLAILRQAQLSRLGYALTLPLSRLRPAVPRQEVWIRASILLGRYIVGAEPRPSPSETAGVIAQIADNHFAEIKNNPPLFYHNDLSASVRRYYWSEDFGYALWIRLVQEAAHAATGAAPQS